MKQFRNWIESQIMLHGEMPGADVIERKRKSLRLTKRQAGKTLSEFWGCSCTLNPAPVI